MSMKSWTLLNIMWRCFQSCLFRSRNTKLTLLQLYKVFLWYYNCPFWVWVGILSYSVIYWTWLASSWHIQMVGFIWPIPKFSSYLFLSKVQNFRWIYPVASMSKHTLHMGRPHRSHCEYTGIIHNTNLLNFLKYTLNFYIVKYPYLFW